MGPRESQGMSGDWKQMSEVPDGKTARLSSCLWLPLLAAAALSDPSKPGSQEEDAFSLS